MHTCQKRNSTPFLYLILTLFTLLGFKEGRGISLHEAIRTGKSFQTIEKLLHDGANVNEQEATSQSTPLHEAVKAKRLDIVRLLLKNKAKVNEKDKEGETPLHFPVSCYQALRNNKKESDNNFEIIKLLLEHGADVNAFDHLGDAPLHVIGMSVDTALTELLLQHHATINLRNRREEIPLHYAIQQNIARTEDYLKYQLNPHMRRKGSKSENTDFYRAMRLSILPVRFLLERGADVNALDSLKLAPLHMATNIGNTELIKLCLEHKANVNLQGGKGLTPLHYAVQHYETLKVNQEAFCDDTDVIALLLKSGADVNTYDAQGRTPLHDAVKAGNLELVTLLLQEGASVHKISKGDNLSPLHIAVQGAHEGIIRILRQHGAKADIPDSVGKTPLDYVPNNEKRETIITALNEKIDKFTLVDAIKSRKPIEDIEKLLQDGANVNEQESVLKQTPLCAAVMMNKIDIVRLLLEKKAMVNESDINDQTPLRWAIRRYEQLNDNIAIIKLLLENGANFKVQRLGNSTPLHEAAIIGKTELVDLLLEHTADIEVQDDDGATPLYRAIGAGKADVVKLLLAKGANVNVQDKKGRTLLHEAAMSGNTDVVNLLLEKKCDVNKGDAAGKTPLHDAVLYDRESMVTFLLQNGADVHGTDSGKSSPLHVAAQKNNKNIMQILQEHGAKAEIPDTSGKTALDYLQESVKRDITTNVHQQGADKHLTMISNLQQGSDKHSSTIFTSKNAIISASVIGILSFLLYKFTKKKKTPTAQEEGMEGN